MSVDAGVVSIQVQEVNPELTFQFVLGGFVISEGQIRLCSHIEATRNRANKEIAINKCEFTRNGTRNEGFATEWAHGFMNHKVGDRIDKPFLNDLRHYLDTTDFWTNVLEYIEKKTTPVQAEISDQEYISAIYTLIKRGLNVEQIANSLKLDIPTVV